MQSNGGGSVGRPPDGTPPSRERRDDETETAFAVPPMVPPTPEPPTAAQPTAQPQPPAAYGQSRYYPPGYPPQAGYPPSAYPPQAGYPPSAYPQQPAYPQLPPAYGQRGYYPPGYPVYQQPYPGYAGYPPGYAYLRKRSTSRGLTIVLVLLLLTLLAVIGLMAGLASGLIRMNDLLGLVGMGPGQIVVQNSTDGPVQVAVERLDEEGTVVRSFAETVGPADVRTYPDRDRGAWDLRFATPGGTALGECKLQVGGNEVYTFIVLRDVIAVSRAGTTPASGDELVVGASSLCRRAAP